MPAPLAALFSLLHQGVHTCTTEACARAVLALNHLLWSDPALSQRLRPHAGRVLAVARAGADAPWWVLRITPAGLTDRVEPVDVPAVPADLTVTCALPQDPAQTWVWLRDPRRSVSLHGDAALAADVAWVMERLRWDAADDLARWTGPVVAGALTQGVARAQTTARGLFAWAQDGLSAWESRRPPRAF